MYVFLLSVKKDRYVSTTTDGTLQAIDEKAGQGDVLWMDSPSSGPLPIGPGLWHGKPVNFMSVSNSTIVFQGSSTLEPNKYVRRGPPFRADGDNMPPPFSLVKVNLVNSGDNVIRHGDEVAIGGPSTVVSNPPVIVHPPPWGGAPPPSTTAPIDTYWSVQDDGKLAYTRSSIGEAQKFTLWEVPNFDYDSPFDWPEGLQAKIDPVEGFPEAWTTSPKIKLDQTAPKHGLVLKCEARAPGERPFFHEIEVQGSPNQAPGSILVEEGHDSVEVPVIITGLNPTILGTPVELAITNPPANVTRVFENKVYQAPGPHPVLRVTVTGLNVSGGVLSTSPQITDKTFTVTIGIRRQFPDGLKKRRAELARRAPGRLLTARDTKLTPEGRARIQSLLAGNSGGGTPPGPGRPGFGLGWVEWTQRIPTRLPQVVHITGWGGSESHVTFKSSVPDFHAPDILLPASSAEATLTFDVNRNSVVGKVEFIVTIGIEGRPTMQWDAVLELTP